VEKDKTDLELALDYLLAAGAGDVTVTGALGGRFDHSLANLNLLSRFEARGLRVGLDDGSERAFLVRPGEVARIEGRPGLTVSLFSATPRCRGITLTGFKYPLSAATLAHGSTLGVSNQLVAPAGTVTLTAGRLIVVVADLAGT
jgi:thiamine pyrophosphokinase